MPTFANYPSALPYLDELHKEDLLAELVSGLEGQRTRRIKPKPESTSNPFINSINHAAKLNLIQEDNVTYFSTSDPCLDLYYASYRVSDDRDLRRMLEAAWAADVDLTLHIIFYIRSIHRGQSLTAPFMSAFSWLLQYHPRTALANLHVLVDGTVRTDAALKAQQREERDFKSHGCWKDLCTILTIYAQGELREAKKDAETYIKKGAEHNAKAQAKAKEAKANTRRERNERVTKLLQADPVYRALHFTIARMFANQLKTDMAQLQRNKDAIEQGVLKGRHALGFNLSLAGKWAPSLCRSHDKHTFLATSIAELLFPPEKHQDDGETREHYLNKVRDLYRKQYLTPLRDALDIVEHYKAEGKWKKIDFTHVPAICLKHNWARFYKHAPYAVTSFLNGSPLYVKKAKSEKRTTFSSNALPRRIKIKGETMLPEDYLANFSDHDVPKTLQPIAKFTCDAKQKILDIQTEITNRQWEHLIESFRKTSLLNSRKSSNTIDLGECIVVCNLKDTMWYESSSNFVHRGVALSLIIANLAKPPFDGSIIAYSNGPTVFKLDTSLPFDEQVRQVMQRVNDPNEFDTKSVFTDVILPLAVKHEVKPEDMIKRVFIITDKNFNFGETEAKKFETAFDLIRRRYHEAGYEVPEMVWWNISGRGCSSMYNLDAPVKKDDVGVKMLAGHSANILKTFLDGDDIDEDTAKQETPLDFARKAVYHESFKDLVVVD
ncbi:uncharacterized protein RHIMIDRAFT_207070 [Rhizopus microsporus ATCC 52813]|uniref:Uncharacterized protein n=1 Tax=Rhizopus microsporus ATCC 52813 TaxID=1340429 RepID=A0A2G4SK17_RHIZD|nr:uncharacterized protein RHIMIDRAFT_207070 [Rhizopus microsporus ATCC 52813]PHZ09114.1 hypothetical protein RHIMIDRAFT_207070 [Rhizopus microsporus ATCC 52813]